MRHLTSTFAAAAIAVLALSGVAQAKSYPVIAYGTRTYVAETTESGGSVLVRVYRRTTSVTWQRYGGFTLPAGLLAGRRAEVRRDPAAASPAERVYFAGRVVGATPFRPSSRNHIEPRFRNLFSD